MMHLYTYCENNQTHPKLLYTCLPNCKKITMNSRTTHGYWWYKRHSTMQQDAFKAKHCQLTFWLQFEEVEGARSPKSPGTLGQAA